jgi:signal transduction histidine kinase
VVINLLSNAIKFADGERPQCEVKTFIENGTFFIEISDNGPGLSPDFLTAHSPQAVHRVDHTSRGRWLGNGLGLTISRRILSTHDGTLIIANTGKPGTCIRAGLPLLPAGKSS